jgi:hypothetical protein
MWQEHSSLACIKIDLNIDNWNKTYIFWTNVINGYPFCLNIMFDKLKFYLVLKTNLHPGVYCHAICDALVGYQII